MACLINSGYTQSCLDSIGGLKQIFITNYDESKIISFDTDGTVNYMQADDYFYFAQEIETATFTEVATASNNNGTSFYESTLILSLDKLNQDLKNQLNIFSKGKFRIILQDNLGQFFLMGLDNPVYVTDIQSTVGKTFGDQTGATITFMSKSKIPTPIIDTDVAIEVLFPEPGSNLSFRTLLNPRMDFFGLNSDPLGANYEIGAESAAAAPTFVNFYALATSYPETVNTNYQNKLPLLNGGGSTLGLANDFKALPQTDLELGFTIPNGITTDPTNPIFMWSYNPAAIASKILRFEDVNGNMASYAPLIRLNPLTNTVTNTLIASIVVELVSSTSAFALVKLTRNHNAIEIPMTAVTTLSMDWDGAVTEDIMDPNIAYMTIPVGKYEIGVFTTYTDTPSGDDYPKSYISVNFEIY